MNTIDFSEALEPSLNAVRAYADETVAVYSQKTDAAICNIYSAQDWTINRIHELEQIVLSLLNLVRDGQTLDEISYEEFMEVLTR